MENQVTQSTLTSLEGLPDVQFNALHLRVAFAACNALDPRSFGFGIPWDTVLDCFDEEYLRRYGAEEEITWDLKSRIGRAQGAS